MRCTRPSVSMSQLFIRSSLNDVARGRYCATDLQFSSEKWELSMSSSFMVLFCRRPDITYATLLEERLLRERSRLSRGELAMTAASCSQSSSPM